MTTDTQLHGKWLTLAHIAWYVCAALAAIVLLAALPVYYTRVTHPIAADPYGLGQFSAPFQVLVDVGDLLGSYISFVLAVLLFWRKPHERMALFVSFFCLVTATTGIFVLSNVLTAYFGAPSTYELWSGLQAPLWVLLLCTFPDGRFVPRWTRWLVGMSFLTMVPIFLFVEWRAVYTMLVNVFIFPALFAQVYRYRSVSNFAERQQTKWWLYGLCVSFALFVISALIYKRPSDPLLNVTPIFLTIAILRSRLWDIDIIIRKTVTYTLVVTIWLLVYFGGVILAQRVFANITGVGNNEVITVISTLVIAALFVPLRNRIQDLIDKRFYRRKYDAQKVLQKFAETVRDETDLDKLTAELVNVVQETTTCQHPPRASQALWVLTRRMQPRSVSVWLKRVDGETGRQGNRETGKQGNRKIGKQVDKDTRSDDGWRTTDEEGIIVG